VNFTFSATVIEWRGPAPFCFLPVPEGESEAIRAAARQLSYGWGVIPVRVRIGSTEFTTSLFPKDGGYLVPLKDAVRRTEGIELDAQVSVEMSVGR
jgi:hypothetical protein